MYVSNTSRLVSMLINTWKDLSDHPDFSPRMVRNYRTVLTLSIDLEAPNARDINGYTLMHLAVFGYMPEMVSNLVHRGWDVNAAANNGFKPYHMLASTMVFVKSSCYETQTNIHRTITTLRENGSVDTVVDGMTVLDMINNLPVVKTKVVRMGLYEAFANFPRALVSEAMEENATNSHMINTTTINTDEVCCSQNAPLDIL